MNAMEPTEDLIAANRARSLKVVLTNLLLSGVVLCMLDLFLSSQRAVGNELSVGVGSKLTAPLMIELAKPMDLNWKNREDILEMRRSAVAKHASLINGGYEPNGDIFGMIEDNKPWWGTAGSAVFGKGDDSIRGPSEESRFLLNPFLLVAPNPATLDIWNADKITDKDINDPDFPFFWQPQSLEFDPRNSRALIAYDLTGYFSRIAMTGKLAEPVTTPKFSLVAYNARDFGYNYIYIDPKLSINVANEHPMNRAVRIRQFIHCGGTCGYPGGCNNMSPFMPEIDRLEFTKLPARIVVDLWKNSPAPNQIPDFMVVIDLR